MTKLDALNKLASAYKYLMQLPKEVWHWSMYDATFILENSFHTVRRSLQSIDETIPEPVTNEGYNGRMPTHF